MQPLSKITELFQMQKSHTHFSPSPNLRSDQWWDCPDSLRITLPVSTQLAELSIAATSGERTAGSTAVVQISWAGPVSPDKTNSSDSSARAAPAIVLSVVGFLTGAISLMFALLFWRKLTAAELLRTQHAGKSVEEMAGLKERITKLEVLSQSETTLRKAVLSEIEQLRKEVRSWKDSKDDVKSSEGPPEVVELVNQGVAPQNEVVSIPSALPLQDDSGGEPVKVGASALLRAVDAWCRQSANFPIKPPSQLAEKINELRAMAEGAKELSAAGSRASSSEWRDLAFSIACLVADHTDKQIDPDRQESRSQALLQKIFESAGIDEILPVRNDSVSEIEHHLVASTPRESARDLSYHVAYVRQRGFRMDGRVIRKAAVTAYD